MLNDPRSSTPDSPRQHIVLLVIGDEILSGKRQDKHLPWALAALAQRGLQLHCVEFLGDHEAVIAEAISRHRGAGRVVLCCGGIGATPDDVTRQAAARAFGLPLELHAEAVALLRAEYGDRATPERLRMVEFPRGAALIPNPLNRVPGFSLGDCFFVPGFPEMAWPMLDWVLDQPLAALHNDRPEVEYRLRVLGTSGESDLLPIMHAVLRAHPGIRLSSLPHRGGADAPRHIEFGVRGAGPQAAAAYSLLRSRLEAVPDLCIEELAAPGMTNVECDTGG